MITQNKSDQDTTIATITIKRNSQRYSYRREMTDAEPVHNDISRHQADMIISNNPRGQMTYGSLDFGHKPSSWTWKVVIREGETVETGL